MAVTDVIASAVAIQQNQEPPLLSVQQLVDHLPLEKHQFDPDFKPDKRGCYPSSFVSAFTFIMRHGLCREEDYPRRRPLGRAFDAIRSMDEVEGLRIHIAGYVEIGARRVGWSELRNIFNMTPLVGYIDCFPSFFDFTGDGIYMGRVGEEKFDGAHAIMIVGFGEEDGCFYYRIKNLWGTKWGMNGFARVRVNLVYKLTYPVLSITPPADG